MQYIPIKTEKKNNKTEYSISAIVLEGKNGARKKIPHPLGTDVIRFDTLEAAQKAIKLAGFEYQMNESSLISQSTTYTPLDKKIFDALMQETKDANPNIVATAINALSQINHHDSVDLFLDKMGEENEKVRGNSIEAIIAYGIDALPKVLDSMKSENWVKRNSAVLCLQKFCELENAPIPQIIDSLLNAINDNNPIVKCSVIQSLGIAYKAYKATSSNN